MLINPSIAEVSDNIPKWGLDHTQIAVRGSSRLPGPDCADESTDSSEQDPEWAISSQNVLGTHVVPVLWINKTCFSLSIHPAPLSSTKSPLKRQAGRNDPLSCNAVKGSIVGPDGFITPLCVIPYTRAYVPKSEKWPVMCVRVRTHSFSTSLQRGTQAGLAAHIPCQRDKAPLCSAAFFGPALYSLVSTRQLGTGLQECAVQPRKASANPPVTLWPGGNIHTKLFLRQTEGNT